MKFKTMTLLPFVLCAGWATAADANYFTNPRLNIMRSVGTARSPTPQDIRTNQMPMIAETAKQVQKRIMEARDSGDAAAQKVAAD